MVIFLVTTCRLSVLRKYATSYSPSAPHLSSSARLQWAEWRRYKFYLALENHICEGYLTEKALKSLIRGQVWMPWSNYALSPPPLPVSPCVTSPPRRFQFT